MLTSFNSALSGLNNNSVAINVIGNNLANINTTSFKAGRVTFAELLGGDISTSASGSPIQQGMGSFVPGLLQVNTQGSLNATGRATDLAISGNGFFVVEMDNGGQAFSRAGSMSLTQTGALINIDGYKVLGYPAVNGVIQTSSPLSPITITKGVNIPPRATANANITANLDSRAEVDSTFSTSVQVIDSLGASHNVTMTFTRRTTTDWSWDATLPATETGGTSADPAVSLGSGTFTFNSSGVLTPPADFVNPTLTLTGLANGASDLSITLGVLDATGKPRFTGFASTSTVSATSQDGFISSVLKDITIGSDGTVSGIFENGQVQPLAQLALAVFPNVDGLLKTKGATLLASASSGEPSVGAPGTGGRGSVLGGSLEQSNVDIAQEFTNLIVAQRGYQANSKIISTTDELYQDAINLKR